MGVEGSAAAAKLSALFPIPKRESVVGRVYELDDLRDDLSGWPDFLRMSEVDLVDKKAGESVVWGSVVLNDKRVALVPEAGVGVAWAEARGRTVGVDTLRT
jgi:hypothetical protein